MKILLLLALLLNDDAATAQPLEILPWSGKVELVGERGIASTVKIANNAGARLVGQTSGKVNPDFGFAGQPTVLKWTGDAGGTLLNIHASECVEISNIAFDGGNTAGVLVLLSSETGWGTGRITFRNCIFRNAKIAVQVGVNEADHNNEQVYFDDCKFLSVERGYVTKNHQAVNHVFVNTTARYVGVLWDFERGGNLASVGGDFGQFDLLLRVGYGGVNAGQYAITSARFELNGKTARHSRLVEAVPQDCVTVSLSDCQETEASFDEKLVDNWGDFLFRIGPKAVVYTTRHVHRDRPVAWLTGGKYVDRDSRWNFVRPDGKRPWRIEGGRVRVFEPLDIEGNLLPGVNR